MKSCIYEGRVVHRRRSPVVHEFTFRFFWLYLDLEELPRIFRRRWFWSLGRPNVAAFHREDYLGDPDVPLDDAVRDLVARCTGKRPTGPIRLLTHLRYMGYVFNPVSFYYCFDEDDTRVDAIVAEITNTPWGERFSYVMSRDAIVTEDSSGMMRFMFDKQFHVSPFMELEQQYDWSFSEPGSRLAVKMDNLGAQGKVFDAFMTLDRREIGSLALARVLVRYPLQTVRIISSIYWQALRLWLRGAVHHPHPVGQATAAKAPAKLEIE